MGINCLLASDMDGTLLNKQQRCSVENQKAVHNFQNQGGKFIIATGRAACSVFCFVCPLGVEHGILLNGALLYDFVNNRAMQVNPMPEEEVRALTQTVLSDYLDVSVQVYCEQVVCLLRGNEIVENRGLREEYCDLVTPSHFLPKHWLTVTLSGPVPNMLEIQERAATDYPNLRLLRSSRHFLEATSVGVSKGTGLEFFANHYGFSLANTVAVGDNENDLPMLQAAGVAMAVENACDSMLQCADHILPDHNNHPIKHAIDIICNDAQFS